MVYFDKSDNRGPHSVGFDISNFIFSVEEETEEVMESKRLEKEGVNAAESGDIMTALEFFNQAVQVAPTRASGYNNRAQALRLKGDIQSKKTL